MKLSEIKQDAAAIEQGQWVGEQHGTPIPEMSDLCVRVRGTGNADWRRLQAKLIAALPRNKRMSGQVDPDEFDRINTKLLIETCLLDWSNLDVPYSKAKAAELLNDPAYRALRDAVFWAATQVGQVLAEDEKEQEKNSAGVSAGTSQA